MCIYVYMYYALIINIHVQPVPYKMRLEMLVGMLNEILNGHRRSLFKRLI